MWGSDLRALEDNIDYPYFDIIQSTRKIGYRTFELPQRIRMIFLVATNASDCILTIYTPLAEVPEFHWSV